MARFSYTAVDQSGARLTDVLEASDRSEVLERLQQRGQLAVDIVEIGPDAPDGRAGHGTDATPSDTAWGRGRRRINETQITLFTRELAMLLQAGLTLPQALEMLNAQAEMPKLEKIIVEIRAGLADGQSLEQALADSGAFPPLYINMVRVGEATGTVREVLARLAEDREREAKLRQSAFSAMLYPGFLIVTAVVAVVIILMVVVPRFRDIVGEELATLPLSAQIVFSASGWLLQYGFWLLFGITALVVLFWLLSGLAPVRRTLEQIAMNLPFVGNLMRAALTVRFTRTLATLLSNGVGLPEALELTGGVMSHYRLRAVIDEMGRELRRGQDYLGPLQASGLFQPLVVNMLRVGSEAGNMGAAAGHLAMMFQDKLEAGIARLFTVLEPLIILLVSALIAGIVIAIMGAVFSVNDLALS